MFLNTTIANLPRRLFLLLFRTCFVLLPTCLLAAVHHQSGCGVCGRSARYTALLACCIPRVHSWPHVHVHVHRHKQPRVWILRTWLLCFGCVGRQPACVCVACSPPASLLLVVSRPNKRQGLTRIQATASPPRLLIPTQFSPPCDACPPTVYPHSDPLAAGKCLPAYSIFSQQQGVIGRTIHIIDYRRMQHARNVSGYVRVRVFSSRLGLGGHHCCFSIPFPFAHSTASPHLCLFSSGKVALGTRCCRCCVLRCLISVRWFLCSQELVFPSRPCVPPPPPAPPVPPARRPSSTLHRCSFPFFHLIHTGGWIVAPVVGSPCPARIKRPRFGRFFFVVRPGLVAWPREGRKDEEERLAKHTFVCLLETWFLTLCCLLETWVCFVCEKMSFVFWVLGCFDP